MIIDTHAHYDDPVFDKDRDVLLRSLFSGGTESVINAGASMESSRKGLELSRRYPFVYCALGVHPNETISLTGEDMNWITGNAADKKVVAIGEIGLDYHFEDPVRSIQKAWFARQIAVARKAKLPVIVHSRDAAQDTLDVIKAENAKEAGGVIHCFSYGKELAEEYLKMGFYIGIGGVVTFKNAKRMKEVVSFAPLTSLLLETDCPYLSPEPNRGMRNSSLNLPYVVKAIAEIKNISEQEVTEVTHDNALRCFPKLNQGGISCPHSETRRTQ